MAGWATYHLVNVSVGEQTVAEEEREKKIELEDSDTRVKLPFRYSAQVFNLAHFIWDLYQILLSKVSDHF